MIRYSKALQLGSHVRLFTDGSCFPNPGPNGGWAFIIRFPDKLPVKRSGAVGGGTSNNRMELSAVIQGLQFLKESTVLELITDSEYVGKGISLWMENWKRSGWRQKNNDLWKELYDLVHFHDVYVTCIRGHNGQPENEECDYLAGKAAVTLRLRS